MRKLKPFLLYHWSPADRRKGIRRNGLKIGSPVAVHSGGWVPWYLCFSDSPSMAWALSGALAEKEGDWDLWMIWSSELESLWRLPRPCAPFHLRRPTEWRTKHSVPRGKLWYVATRHHKPRRPTEAHCSLSTELHELVRPPQP